MGIEIYTDNNLIPRGTMSAYDPLQYNATKSHVAYPTSAGYHHRLLCNDAIEDSTNVVMLEDARNEFRKARTVNVDCKACIRLTARTLC